MRFLKIKCCGSFNSFRQPDFHTYHKTLPLPPKTTVAGMLGSAMGIGPKEINDQWLKPHRFQMGVVGRNSGKANDLWQIRKYESKRITAFNKGEEPSPYKTAVIVRELLYQAQFLIYLSFSNPVDYDEIKNALSNPAWALSLGREDELIKIQSITEIELDAQSELSYSNTVLPQDINVKGYTPLLENFVGVNLLAEAPRINVLPITFTHKKGSEVREADETVPFSFISELPIKLNDSLGYHDEDENVSFEIF
jgi:CRISPR-associated protein Cas5t